MKPFGINPLGYWLGGERKFIWEISRFGHCIGGEDGFAWIGAVPKNPRKHDLTHGFDPISQDNIDRALALDIDRDLSLDLDCGTCTEPDCAIRDSTSAR